GALLPALGPVAPGDRLIVLLVILVVLVLIGTGKALQFINKTHGRLPPSISIGAALPWAAAGRTGRCPPGRGWPLPARRPRSRRSFPWTGSPYQLHYGPKPFLCQHKGDTFWQKNVGFLPAPGRRVGWPSAPAGGC